MDDHDFKGAIALGIVFGLFCLFFTYMCFDNAVQLTNQIMR